MITLRDYQTELVNKAREALTRCKRFILVAPTGAGKTRTACHIIESAVKKNNTVVILVNRDKLVKQWHEVLDGFNIEHGIIQYGEKPNNAPVQLASVDSYVTRLDKKYDITISDECHYALGENYRACIEHQVGVSIGLTATPTKMSGEGFAALYDEIIQGVEMEWLIKNGYLAPMEIYSANPPDLDMDLVDGDFNTAQYMRRVSGTKRISNAIEQWNKYAKDKLTIVFAVNISDAKRITAEFNEAGISAKCIHSKLKQATQDTILSDFKARKYMVLISVNILSEGFDCPWIEAGVDMAPTASLSRYLQKWGRCIRAYDGKQSAVMLDLCGNYYLHGAPWKHHEWSLEGRKPSKRALTEAMLTARLCTSCGHMYDSSKPACPYCGESVKKAKRLIKEKAGKLVLVTGEEVAKREEEERKAEARKEEYKRRKKAARTLEEYQKIERDFNLKSGWGYVNWNIYKKYLDKYRR